MRIFMGCDHKGIALKRYLMEELVNIGFEPHDVGCHSDTRIDYPDIARSISQNMTDDVDRGILICGSGVGMSIAANRFSHLRAALTQEPVSAALSRQHNDANVICFGARIVGEAIAWDCTRTFLFTDFEGGRHSARVETLRIL